MIVFPTTLEQAQADYRLPLWRDPAKFARVLSRGEWQEAAHLRLLANKLLALARGESTRLIVEMPPRHGKSELCSHYFPAWFVGNFPEKRVILASYEHDFAAGWGRRAKAVIAEWGKELWGRTLAPDHQAIDDWQLAGHEGGMICAGVGGPITGRGADLLVIDDPVKSAEEANSDTYRERAWDWFRSTAYTRLEPGGAVVLVMTRWHQDDLVGRILAEARQKGEPWEVLRLTALAEPGDALRRAEGAALWPERYPRETLHSIRENIGPYWWQALYQQRPASPEGALFKDSWWRFYRGADLRKEETGRLMMEQVLQSWDMAFKDTQDSSYVVGQVWGRQGANLYLLDQVRERMDFASTVLAVQMMSARWPEAVAKLVEDKANGPAVISSLRGRVPGLIAVQPKGGKLSRAQSVLPLVAAGNVWIPSKDEQLWVTDFLAEASAFPVGATDDQVDAMSQGLQWFLGLASDQEARKVNASIWPADGQRPGTAEDWSGEFA